MTHETPLTVHVTTLMHRDHVAGHATASWLADYQAGKADLQCLGCNQIVAWKDVEPGDEYEQRTAGVEGTQE